MAKVEHIEQGLVVAILPFIHGKKYRINCLVESLIKWKPTDTKWCLYNRHVTYKDGMFKKEEDMITEDDNKYPMSEFYQRETTQPKFDYFTCFIDEKEFEEEFVILPDLVVKANNCLDIWKLDLQDLFYQIFKDLLTTKILKQMLYKLFDPKIEKEKAVKTVNLLFELEKKTYPGADNHERIFCSRAASCYNLILTLKTIEQTQNSESMLSNSSSIIIKVSNYIGTHNNTIYDDITIDAIQNK